MSYDLYSIAARPGEDPAPHPKGSSGSSPVGPVGPGSGHVLAGVRAAEEHLDPAVQGSALRRHVRPHRPRRAGRRNGEQDLPLRPGGRGDACHPPFQFFEQRGNDRLCPLPAEGEVAGWLTDLVLVPHDPHIEAESPLLGPATEQFVGELPNDRPMLGGEVRTSEGEPGEERGPAWRRDRIEELPLILELVLELILILELAGAGAGAVVHDLDPQWPGDHT